MSGVDPQARPGRRRLQGRDEPAADLVVGRPLEGRQQAVDLQRPGGPHRVGQGEQLVASERRPRQHVGGEDPGRDGAVRAQPVEQEREEPRARPRPGRRARRPAPPAGRRPGPPRSGRRGAGPRASPSAPSFGHGRARAVADGLADSSASSPARTSARAVDPRARDAPSGRPGPSPGARSSAPPARPRPARSRSASKSWTASDGASRASWSRELGPLGLGQVLGRRQPLAEEAGQRLAPLRVAAGDPRGGLLQRRVGRGEQGGDRVGVEPAALHLVERDQGGAAGAGLLRESPAAGGLRGRRSRSGRRSASAPARGRSAAADASSSAGTADLSPIRPRASAAARRLCGEPEPQQRDQRRGRVAVAPDARRVARRLADRLVGVGQGRPGDRAGVGVVDPRRGPDGVPAGLGRTPGADGLRQRRDGVAALLRPGRSRPAGGRPAAGRPAGATRSSADIAAHASFRPRGSSTFGAPVRRTR